jgi:N-acetylneuraminic acid mutarotase
MISSILTILFVITPSLVVLAATDQWSWKDVTPRRQGALSKREGHTAVAAEHMLVVFGGCYLDRVCFNDVQVLDTNTNEWMSPIVDGVKPAPREGHSASLIGTSMWVFGGSSDVGYMQDVHVLNLEIYGDRSTGNEPHMAWGRPDIKGDAPEAREGHTGTAIDRGVLIFGGVAEKGYRNDMFLLEIDTMSWKLVEPKAGVAPSPREGHTATIYMDKLFIFGGFTDRGDVALNDMHVFDVKSSIWSLPNFSGDRPKPRQYASSIRHGSKMLFTGGCDFTKKSCFNDMYELDLKSKSWSQTEFMSDKSYPPREDFTLTVVRERVLLVGGCFLTHRCFGGDEISELVTPHDGFRCGANNCT